MIARFVKANPVFVLAGAAAIVSMFFVPPNAGYTSYIDWRTVGLLLCQLMDGPLDAEPVHRTDSGLLLCFHAGHERRVSDFIRPADDPSAFCCRCGGPADSGGGPRDDCGESGQHADALWQSAEPVPFQSVRHSGGSIHRNNAALYFGFPWAAPGILWFSAEEGAGGPGRGRESLFWADGEPLLLALCIIFFLFADRKVLRRVNYILPLTFIVFFILTGNIQALPGFSEALSAVIKGHEMFTAVVASQVISNVPAAMLLSSFTNDYRALIVGTDIGGLGTLIASMASLISFQFYCGAEGSKPGKYIGVFTVLNAAYLLVLLLMAWFL